MPKLRPINETRRANGQLTSETGARLLRRRGGLHTQQRHRQSILERLARMRIKSLITRNAQSLAKQTCRDCKLLSISLTEALNRLESLYQQRDQSQQ